MEKGWVVSCCQLGKVDRRRRGSRSKEQDVTGRAVSLFGLNEYSLDYHYTTIFDLYEAQPAGTRGMFTSIEQRRRTNSPRPGPGINLEAEMKKGKKRWDVRVFLMGVGCLLLLAAVLLSFFNGETQSSSPVVQLSHANSLKHAKDEVVNVSLPVVGSKPFSAVKKASCGPHPHPHPFPPPLTMPSSSPSSSSSSSSTTTTTTSSSSTKTKTKTTSHHPFPFPSPFPSPFPFPFPFLFHFHHLHHTHLEGVQEALESLARLNNETRVDHDNKASEGSEAKREEAGQNGVRPLTSDMEQTVKRVVQDASSVGRQTFEASPQSLQNAKVIHPLSRRPSQSCPPPARYLYPLGRLQRPGVRSALSHHVGWRQLQGDGSWRREETLESDRGARNLRILAREDGSSATRMQSGTGTRCTFEDLRQRGTMKRLTGGTSPTGSSWSSSRKIPVELLLSDPTT
eukprot:755451-Hanusia_phi.AAC.3